ncbi:hypothetical protein LPC08_06690 [Roseomonas sp. OT10]|uniref:hypothetical protein n=1 Tax=Roseomonas cutis TaxID=2897332 RepID=UPI001E491579|nr:hypothetical protein [Roseomonas sp. OT10]UFN50307.1 hypothetical protein LPC08_06690 [Roseomonas sp. OT10]
MDDPSESTLELRMDQAWTTIDAADDLRLGEVMPAWFAGRMMADDWPFALLLSTGQAMLIRRIDSIHVSHSGQVLLDVNMATELSGLFPAGKVLVAPTGRTRATVNLSHVVAAFEVEDGPDAEE